MIEQPYTHVGIVVDDLEAACDRYRRDLGLEFAEVISWTLDLWTPDGVVNVPSTFTYAAGGTPSIELLQSVPGTTWQTSGGAHHIGYWSTELASDSAELVGRGYQLTGTLATADGEPSGFAYHAHPDGGPLLELVDARLAPRFERWWAGGRF